MKTYKEKVRTTIDLLENIPYVGIYIISYFGRIIYIGKAQDSVAGRLTGHLYNREVENLGYWLDNMRFDWKNISLDILECPDNVDSKTWLEKAEEKCILKFKPLFNDRLNN